jgi:hypothetical protein
MTLQQKLDDFKAQFESGGPPYNAPKSIIEVFHRATEELRQSGLAERALKTGDRAPAFTRNNQDGTPISSVVTGDPTASWSWRLDKLLCPKYSAWEPA